MISVAEIAILGGGELGAFSVQQLRRAERARALSFTGLVVVDHDPDCVVARGDGAGLELSVSDCSRWLETGLDRLEPGSHLVPHHRAPHLLLGWLGSRVERAGGRVQRRVGAPGPGAPFERPTGDGDLALSYATWTCPPTCVEPDLCPHTKGPRSWTLAGELASRPVDGIDATIVFRCLHLAYGVSTVPVADVLAARDKVVSALASGRRCYLVATSSHCHGLLAELEVQP